MGYKNFFLTQQILKLMMEEGTREAQNPSTPPLVHFTQLQPFLRNQFSQNFPEGLGIQKPPPMVGTSGCNYARCFHIFILILRLIG